jgi:hypothetical protein
MRVTIHFEFDMNLLLQKERERRAAEPDDTHYTLLVLQGRVAALTDTVREAMLTHDKYKDSELHEMPPHRKAHYRSHFLQRLREIQATAAVWCESLEAEALEAKDATEIPAATKEPLRDPLQQMVEPACTCMEQHPKPHAPHCAKTIFQLIQSGNVLRNKMGHCQKTMECTSYSTVCLCACGTCVAARRARLVEPGAVLAAPPNDVLAAPDSKLAEGVMRCGEFVGVSEQCQLPRGHDPAEGKHS